MTQVNFCESHRFPLTRRLGFVIDRVHEARLRRVVRIDSGEPDDLLVAEPTINVPAEFAAEV